MWTEGTFLGVTVTERAGATWVTPCTALQYWSHFSVSLHLPSLHLKLKLSHFGFTFNSTLPSHLTLGNLWSPFLLLAHSLSAHLQRVSASRLSHSLFRARILPIRSQNLSFLYFPFNNSMGVSIFMRRSPILLTWIWGQTVPTSMWQWQPGILISIQSVCTVHLL